MKRNLLVTLADEGFIDRAKQLFSGVYHNAGWQGDYMLLAHEIPEKKLRWFRDKGILVKECSSLCNKHIKASSKASLTRLCRFYLFTPEFKKWDNIIYLDADIIVRGPLEKLTKVQGFAAVNDCLSKNKLLDQFISKYEGPFHLLKSKYNLKKPAFNSGVIAFNTATIDKDTFRELLRLLERYGGITRYPDQALLNLFFYGRWTSLPRVYNALGYFIFTSPFIKNKNVKAIAIHFIGGLRQCLPWNKENSFYDEWMRNFKKADLIDLKNIKKVKKWPKWQVIAWSFCWKGIYFLHFSCKLIDKYIGLIGILLRKTSPGLYSVLRRKRPII